MLWPKTPLNQDSWFARAPVASMMNDLLHAGRRLLRTPGFTVVAVCILALCLGANLAIFAVMDAIVVRSLPFPESERLVTLYNTYPKVGLERTGASLPNYYERRGNIPALPSISLLQRASGIVGEPGATEQIDVLRVTPEFFTTLGSGPAVGRSFRDSEMTYGSDGVVILTDSYWRRHFQAEPRVLGQVVRVDGLAKVIVGILPPGFRFLSSRAQLYLPLSSNPEDRQVGDRHSDNGYQMMGRLGSGSTLAEAQSQIDANNALHAADDPAAVVVADAGFRTKVAPLHADHIHSILPVLSLLQGAALFLLAVGSVNLINLMLVRTNDRDRELAIRQALGAGRRHLIREVLGEGVLVIILGGGGGLALGAVGLRLLSLLGVDQLPMGAAAAFNGRIVAAGLIAILVIGVATALPLAWVQLRMRPRASLASGDRSATGGHAAQRLRHGFMMAQIALAYMLVAGAAMLSLSLRHALEVTPGFQPDHVLTGRIFLPWKSYSDWPLRTAFVERLLGRLAREPLVSAAGTIDQVPFSGDTVKTGFTVEGQRHAPGAIPQPHEFFGIAGDLFHALGIPLKEGRYLGSTDMQQRLCVVDEDFARTYWPNGGALGHRVYFGANPGPEEEGFRIVGVVGSIRHSDLTEAGGQGAVYVPYPFRTVTDFFLVARTRQSPATMALGLQRMVRGLDPDLPVSDVRSMDDRITDSLLPRRSPALLAGAFAALALLLVALGTYGVLAFAVSRRRREIGVRMALGARPVQVGRQFLAMALRLLAAGIGIGLLGSWAAGRALQSVLFRVPTLHAPTLLLATSALAVVAVLACLLPTLRATRIDPTEALRDDGL